jgi:hypothetical protein
MLAVGTGGKQKGVTAFTHLDVDVELLGASHDGGQDAPGGPLRSSWHLGRPDGRAGRGPLWRQARAVQDAQGDVLASGGWGSTWRQTAAFLTRSWTARDGPKTRTPSSARRPGWALFVGLVGLASPAAAPIRRRRKSAGRHPRQAAGFTLRRRQA